MWGREIFFIFTKVMEKRIINYSFLLILIASVSFYQTAQILRRVIESVHEANKVWYFSLHWLNDIAQYSILTIGSITVWDGFICITHLMLAMHMEVIYLHCLLLFETIKLFCSCRRSSTYLWCRFFYSSFSLRFSI